MQQQPEELVSGLSVDSFSVKKNQLLNVVSNLMENSVKYSGDIVNIHVFHQEWIDEI